MSDSQTNFTSSAPSTPPVSPSSTAITLPDDIPNYDQVPPRIPFQDTINEWVGDSPLEVDRAFVRRVGVVLQQVLGMERNTYDHLNKVSACCAESIPH